MQLWVVMWWCIIVFALGYFFWIKLERILHEYKFEKGKKMYEAASIVAAQMNHNLYFIDNDLEYSHRFKQLDEETRIKLTQALIEITSVSRVKSLILVDTTDKSVVGRAKFNFENDSGQIIKQVYGITINHWL